MTQPAWERRTEDGDIGELYDRAKRLEALNDGPWIYVGTVGVDGVDDLLTDDSPPFENFWTNSFGGFYEVSFMKTLRGFVKIRGGFVGGADGTVVFTLPEDYWPARIQPMVIPTADPAHYATVAIHPNGEVVFGTVV